jgi:hypothetical protein
VPPAGTSTAQSPSASSRGTYPRAWLQNSTARPTSSTPSTTVPILSIGRLWLPASCGDDFDSHQRTLGLVADLGGEPPEVTLARSRSETVCGTRHDGRTCQRVGGYRPRASNASRSVVPLGYECRKRRANPTSAAAPASGGFDLELGPAGSLRRQIATGRVTGDDGRRWCCLLCPGSCAADTRSSCWHHSNDLAARRVHGQRNRFGGLNDG